MDLIAFMDPNEIFEYAFEGMTWTLSGGLSWLGYYVALGSLNHMSILFTEKIGSQAELEEAVKEESKKLEIYRSIKAVFHDKLEGYCGKNEDGIYEIHVGGHLARMGTVRHELYHIFKEHPDQRSRTKSKLVGELNFVFRQEPQALAYTLLGLRL